MKILPSILIWVLLGLPAASQAFQRQMEFCSLLAKCGLEYPEEHCPDSLRVGIKDVEYNDGQCREARKYVDAGISPNSVTGFRLYGFLGQRYRVDYFVRDSLPIRTEPFEFLLDDIPLAAKVVNTFKKTKYEAKYLDGARKRYWKGNNGGNLSGEAELISGGIPDKHLIYFGFGQVKIIKWKLRGKVLFEYDYKVGQNGVIHYDLNVTVFPGGAIVNTIMNMGLFKKVVKSNILDVFEDITDSAEELRKTSYPEMLKKYSWSEPEKKKLKVLMDLLHPNP